MIGSYLGFFTSWSDSGVIWKGQALKYLWKIRCSSTCSSSRSSAERRRMVADSWQLWYLSNYLQTRKDTCSSRLLVKVSSYRSQRIGDSVHTARCCYWKLWKWSFFGLNAQAMDSKLRIQLRKIMLQIDAIVREGWKKVTVWGKTMQL